MPGKTIKNYNIEHFLQLCELYNKMLESKQFDSDFIILSVQLHAAKGTVPKRYWRFIDK